MVAQNSTYMRITLQHNWAQICCKIAKYRTRLGHGRHSVLSTVWQPIFIKVKSNDNIILIYIPIYHICVLFSKDSTYLYYSFIIYLIILLAYCIQLMALHWCLFYVCKKKNTYCLSVYYNLLRGLNSKFAIL